MNTSSVYRFLAVIPLLLLLSAPAHANFTAMDGAIVAAPITVRQYLIMVRDYGKAFADAALREQATRPFKAPPAALPPSNTWKNVFPVGGKITGIILRKVAFPLMAADFIMSAYEAYKMMEDGTSAAPTPTGWTNPDTPPTTGTATITYTVDNPCCTGKTYSTATAACADFGKTNGYTYVGLNGRVCTNSAGGVGIGLGTTLTCPSGYQNPGDGVCHLNETDPQWGIAKWPSDGIGTGHPRDPDPHPGKPYEVSKGGIDENGNPQWERTKQNADGTMEHTRKTQLTRDGVNEVLTEQFKTDALGDIINSSVTSEPNKTLDTDTGTVTGPGGSTGNTTINLPTDYARENTLQATNTALTQANTKLGEIKDELTKLKEPSSSPLPTPSPEATTMPLPGITPPGVAGACPDDIVIPVAGTGKSFTIPLSFMCTFAGYLRAIAITMALLTAALIIFV